MTAQGRARRATIPTRRTSSSSPSSPCFWLPTHGPRGRLPCRRRISIRSTVRPPRTPPPARSSTLPLCANPAPPMQNAIERPMITTGATCRSPLTAGPRARRSRRIRSRARRRHLTGTGSNSTSGHAGTAHREHGRAPSAPLAARLGYTSLASPRCRRFALRVWRPIAFHRCPSARAHLALGPPGRRHSGA